MKVHNHLHKHPLLDHILGQMNPVHILKSNFFNIHFNITLTKQVGLDSISSALNSVGSPLKPLSEHKLSWLRFFMVLLSATRQNVQQYLNPFAPELNIWGDAQHTRIQMEDTQWRPW